jgi:drug/metabolite transporter (DMT)-like permease
VFAGGAIALAGAAVIAAASGDGGVVRPGGVLLCLLAAAAYAGGVVTEKVVLRRVSALQTVFSCCVVGAVACSPFLPALIREAGSASGGSLVWLAYLGVFPTAIGFTTWAYALARTGAARLGALAYLAPPISIVLGWLLLGESPPALALAGGATSLFGVAVSRRRRGAARSFARPARRRPGWSRGSTG